MRRAMTLHYMAVHHPWLSKSLRASGGPGAVSVAERGRLDIYVCDFFAPFANPLFDSPDGLGSVLDSEARTKAEIEHEEHLFGRQVHREHADDAEEVSLLIRGLAHRIQQCGACTFANEKV